MPPKKGKEEKVKEPAAEDKPVEKAQRIPGTLDEDGQARPEDVLELVAARMKLDRSMQARSDLDEANRQLRDQLGQQKFEQSEIFAYLNKELTQKSRVVAKLESRVAELESDVRGGRDTFDSKLMGEKSDARDATTKLAKEVGKYEKELGDLNMFISRKAELETELEETKTELLRERKKHEQIISELERKTVQEKERLRKEMENKIREAKETFMKMTDSQLETTTKKTMQENEQMASELAFQNRETERLLQKNKKLADENLITRRELALYRQAEEELARRNHAYLKTIQSLLSKLKSLEGAKQDIERMSKDKEHVISGSYKTRVGMLQDSVEETYQKLDQMRQELEGKSKEVEKLQQTKEDISVFILQAANEAKERLSGVKLSGSVPEDEDEGFGGQGVPILPNLQELPESQKMDVLRFMVARVSEMQNAALKSAGPASPRSDVGGVSQGDSFLPKLGNKKAAGARSEALRDARDGRSSIQRDARTELGSVSRNW